MHIWVFSTKAAITIIMPSAGIISVLSLVEAEIPLNNVENFFNLELHFWGHKLPWGVCRGVSAGSLLLYSCCGCPAVIFSGLLSFKKTSQGGASPLLCSSSTGPEDDHFTILLTKGKPLFYSAKGQGGFQANVSFPPLQNRNDLRSIWALLLAVAEGGNLQLL